MKTFLVLFFVCFLVACSGESSTSSSPEVSSSSSSQKPAEIWRDSLLNIVDTFDASVDCPEHLRGTFTDERDGKVYKYTTIGGQVWMAENLNVSKTVISRMYPCRYTEDDCERTGYDFTNPYGEVCPVGWHVPTLLEWNELIKTLGGIELADKRLRATEDWMPLNIGDEPNGTDDCGFTLIPASLLKMGMLYEGYLTALWVLGEENSCHTIYFQTDTYMQLDKYLYNQTQDTQTSAYIRCIKD